MSLLVCHWSLIDCADSPQCRLITMALKDLIVLFTLCHGKAIIPSKLSFYTSSKSIPPSPEPPISNCQCAFPREASNMFISLTTAFYVKKNLLNLTWPPAVHGEDLPHLNGRKASKAAKVKLSNKWDQRGIRRKIWVIQICFFFKSVKTKNYTC